MGATVALDVRNESIAEHQKKLGMKEGFDVGLEMSGNPAASPAARTTSIARSAQRAARAEGRKTTALRVLAATIALNSSEVCGVMFMA